MTKIECTSLSEHGIYDYTCTISGRQMKRTRHSECDMLIWRQHDSEVPPVNWSTLKIAWHTSLVCSRFSFPSSRACGVQFQLRSSANAVMVKVLSHRIRHGTARCVAARGTSPPSPLSLCNFPCALHRSRGAPPCRAGSGVKGPLPYVDRPTYNFRHYWPKRGFLHANPNTHSYTHACTVVTIKWGLAVYGEDVQRAEVRCWVWAAAAAAGWLRTWSSRIARWRCCTAGTCVARPWRRWRSTGSTHTDSSCSRTPKRSNGRAD